jgi:hypothetical protein
MVKAILTSTCRRMGGRVISLIAETPGIEFAGGVGRKGHRLELPNESLAVHTRLFLSACSFLACYAAELTPG